MTVAFAAMLALGISARGSVMRMAQQNDLQANDSTAKVQEEVLNEASIVDEVIWVVGDEPILKSDVEAMRLQAEVEGVHFKEILIVRFLSRSPFRSFISIRPPSTLLR